jgi:hypothetical protein
MGNVVKLFHGRTKRGKPLPKPVECKDCGDPIETARLQAVPNATRCISCALDHERSFHREMSAIRDWQTIKIVHR